MAIDPKTDLEVIYVPTQGLDYSKPYNTLAQNNLAPGSINTQSINGFLCSSPYVCNSPYQTSLAAGEVVVGICEYAFGASAFGTPGYGGATLVLIVTNVAVYTSALGGAGGTPLALGTLSNVHTWNTTTEFIPLLYSNGQTIAFVEINDAGGVPGGSRASTIYFTGPMLGGVYSYNAVNGFLNATTYVAGSYMIELGGRLVIGEATFPTGGGPVGHLPAPTIAWSGVGAFSGSGVNDPWNPANFNTLAGNVGGFNLLSDQPDQITGLYGEGRSAGIYRQHGLSQMDPGPSGIDPFLFYHLWSSQFGQGAWANTSAQYGELCIFLADDNVYQMSLQGGLTAVGANIIADITTLRRKLELQGGTSQVINNPGAWAINYWYFSSIISIAGQLHYLLVFNAQTEPLPSTTTSYVCRVYDYNINEQSWNVWDFSQYITQAGAGVGFNTLSTPITFCGDSFNVNDGAAVNVLLQVRYFLFGAISSTGPTSGKLFLIIPVDYDVNTIPYTNYTSNVYAPRAMPIPLIKFRGEVVQLGHLVSMRRLRIQSQNAPFPQVIAGYQGQVKVTLTGPTNGSQTSQAVNMNATSLMQTAYGDVRLADEMIQASIAPVITVGNVWKNLPLLRISTVSVIATDTKGATG